MFILKLKKRKKGKIEVRTHTTHPLDSPKVDPTLSPPLRSLSLVFSTHELFSLSPPQHRCRLPPYPPPLLLPKPML